MPGPWGKYQSTEPSSSGKPWERYAQQPAESKDRQLEAGVKGFLHGGIGLGFGDELAGGLEAAGSVVGLRGVGGNFGDIHRATPEEEKQSFGDVYRQGRETKRQDLGQLEAENPGTYTGMSVLGSLALPIPGAGARTLKNLVGGGAAYGGAAGLGFSTADITKNELPRALGETAEGAMWGAGLGAASKGIRSTSELPKKAVYGLANTFLDAPKEILETYVKDPKGVRAAPTRFELYKQKIEPNLDKLKEETISGSKESRRILEDEGVRFDNKGIADVYLQKARDIKMRSEGVMDDPQVSAAYSWLKDTGDKFKKVRDPGLRPSSEKLNIPSASDAAIGADLDEIFKRLEGGPYASISSNRLKDTIQGIDRLVDWDVGAGKFGKVADAPKKEIRADLDSILKKSSPAYADQMQKVAKDTELLGQMTDVAKSPQSWTNVFRRLNNDQFGAGQVPKETVQKFGERMGFDALDDIKKSLAREAFAKTAIQGSRKVQSFGAMGESIAGEKGRVFGKMVGAVADKYGRPIARSVVDTVMELNQLYQGTKVEKFVEAIQPIVKEAKNQNIEAVLILQLLQKANPEAMKYVKEGQ